MSDTSNNVSVDGTWTKPGKGPRRCQATFEHEVAPDLISGLPCDMPEGHWSQHHATVTENRTTPERQVRITTTISWRETP